MSNSSLVSVNVPAYSRNYAKGRDGRKIEKITVHHMAGVLTAKRCGELFQDPNKWASSHYGIGNDGAIGQYVDETNTSYCDGNWDSNCKSVTIEVSNSTKDGWRVSDKALSSLIRLVADIGKRNNLGTLVKGKNVTWHSMYAATSCPGPYLLSKMDYIVAEANKINYPPKEENIPSFTPYTVKVNTVSLNIRKGAGTNYAVVGSVKKGQTYTIVEEANGKGATKWGKLESGIGWISLDYCKEETIPTFTPYTVKVDANVLNVRKGAGTNYPIVTTVKKGQVYTIVAESDGSGAKKWGKLKSGVGWISLDYVKKA